MSTRDRIVDVAEEIISLHGMDGLRLKDVAKQVGIQPPSVFTHFDGREAIGNAVAHRVLEQIARVIDAALADGGDEEARLRRGACAIAGHLYDHPGHARMILRDLARTQAGPELELWSPTLLEITSQVEALLAAGVAAGTFRPLPPGAFLPAWKARSWRPSVGPASARATGALSRSSRARKSWPGSKIWPWPTCDRYPT